MSPSDSPPGNIVLTGFMGTGKTAVGRLLAEHLGLEFVDTDTIIEDRHGPIPDIFEKLGEPAFRAFERELSQELAGSSGQVIATGGGLMLDAENAAALSDNGTVYCLTASTDEILRRLLSSHRHDRPLLQAPDPARRIVELLADRASGYAAFERIITDDLSPAEVALDLIRKLGAGATADDFGDERG